MGLVVCDGCSFEVREVAINAGAENAIELLGDCDWPVRTKMFAELVAFLEGQRTPGAVDSTSRFILEAHPSKFGVGYAARSIGSRVGGWICMGDGGRC